jgi:thymidylate kinase
MKIVTISGLDGSGKSTQIQLLKNYLESQNKRVFYFHAISFGLANKINNLKEHCLICRLLGKCKIKKNNSEDSVTKANKLQINLRKIFLKIDLSRFNKLIVKLEREGYDYLVSDRYFYDNVVNIEYLSSCHSERVKRDEESNKIIGFLDYARDDIMKPIAAIYLQTDPKVIMQRERIPDQGLEYLEKKKEIYDKYSSVWNLKIIDGSRSKEEIFEEIKQYVS